MSLRVRIGVIAAIAVAVAVLAASVGMYVATARTLRGAVDDSLVALARDVARGPLDRPRLGVREGRLGGAGGFVQVVTADGQVRVPRDQEPLPVTDEMIAVAAGERRATFRTVQADGEPVRVLTVPVSRGLAAQVARPIVEVESILTQLRRRLALGSLGGIALAALLGTVVARRAIRPVHDLTDVAEEIATTHDLTRRIDVERDDEIGRLAHTLNGMLANLEQARRAQEQLVADASHELRTPLTSLRTNIEVLADVDQLPAADRRRLVDDVVVQLDEFARLVGALTELAQGERPARTSGPVRLDELVESTVDRIRTYAGAARPIVVEARPSTVVAEPDRIERAVANLLDNALKYGGAGPIEVTVTDGRVEVRDHGSGVDAVDRDHIFDRFYRATSARSAPGSGLGLAIVQQIARSHGGTVRVEDAPGGGARFVLELPTVDADRETVPVS